jgi:hypothetical protein
MQLSEQSSELVSVVKEAGIFLILSKIKIKNHMLTSAYELDSLSIMFITATYTEGDKKICKCTPIYMSNMYGRAGIDV